MGKQADSEEGTAELVLADVDVALAELVKRPRYEDPLTYLAVDPSFDRKARTRAVKGGVVKQSESEKRAARMAGVFIAIQAGAASVPEAAALVGTSKQALHYWFRQGGNDVEPYKTFVEGYMLAVMRSKLRHVANMERGALVDWRASEALLKRLDAMPDPIQQSMDDIPEEEQIEHLADYGPVQDAVLKRLGLERPEED